MKSRLNIALITLLIAIVSTPVFAGLKPATHSGFYIGFGLGWGSLKVELEDDYDDEVNYITDAQDGGAGYFRLGGALSNKLLLGVEANSWVKDYTVEFGSETFDARVTVSNVALCLTYYPTEYFFLKGGPAFAQSELEFEVPDSPFSGTVEDEGAGLMLGAGGELRLTRRFAIVPSAQWFYQKFDEYKVNVFSLTLGVGWFW